MTFHNDEIGIVFMTIPFLFMKICKMCDEELPYTEFHKDRARVDGHLDRCKRCTKVYMNDLKNGVKLTPEERRKIMQQSKQEWKQSERQITMDMLRVMGYDPESTIPIYQQFIDKHQLTFDSVKRK